MTSPISVKYEGIIKLLHAASDVTTNNSNRQIGLYNWLIPIDGGKGFNSKGCKGESVHHEVQRGP